MIYTELSDIDINEVYRAIGLVGFGLYVFGFTLLSCGRLTSARPTYFAISLVAATCVLISNAADFNLPSVLIQVFYITVSTGAIMLRYGRRNPIAN